MAFTYDTSTDRGKVRFAIGDTVDETARDESLTDAEVDLILASYTDLHQAAIIACRRLMARLRKKITFSAGAVSAQMREKLDGLKETLESLKDEASGHSQMNAYAGMISQDEIDDHDEDRPRRPLAGGRGEQERATGAVEARHAVGHVVDHHVGPGADDGALERPDIEVLIAVVGHQRHAAVDGGSAETGAD